MCGIMGYIGHRDASTVLMDGLHKLEYRGYDSAGIAVVRDDKINVAKKAGKLSNLKQRLSVAPLHGTLGIGHTRWATHGAATDNNAHPHQDCGNDIAIIHNGIIENYAELKESLLARGHRFLSETDTEVIVHLIESQYEGDLAAAVRRAIAQIRGAYAFAVIHRKHREIVVARSVSPIVVGVGKGEMIVASDVTALLPYTKDVVYLHDREIAVVREDGVTITDFDGNHVKRPTYTVTWESQEAEKGEFEHFMLKEIYQQPHALADFMACYFNRDSDYRLDLTLDAKSIEKVHIVACGSAYNAGALGKYYIETFARLPVEVDIASEYRYKTPIVDDRTLVIGVSQSGETLDTIEAIRNIARQGVHTLGVVNAPGSTLAREVDAVLWLRCGPEIGVASTKAYTSMVLAMLLLALWLGRARGTLSEERIEAISTSISALPGLLSDTLEFRERVAHVAEKYHQANNFLFLGRGMHVVTAYEGALKLKEVSYIHAEAYPAGELKHGPIALIDERLPVVIIAPEGAGYEKNLSTMQEIRARGGHIIAIATDGDCAIEKIAQDVLYVPSTDPWLVPILASVLLQILAYEIARLLDRDIDQPRNLAKSVTVE